jgi:hypothetical protein
MSKLSAFVKNLKVAWKTIKEIARLIAKYIVNFFDPLWNLFNDNVDKNKENIFKNVWDRFIAFFNSFFHKSTEELTPQEKIAKSRSQKYGFKPSATWIQFILKMARPFIIIACIGGAVLINYLTQKKYIGELLLQNTEICGAIFQSDVYKGVNFDPIYIYYYNTLINPHQNDYLYLRDYYMPCSYKTYLSCGYETLPVLSSIGPIISAGARVLHFDVFEDLIHHVDMDVSDESELDDIKSKFPDATFIPMVRSATNAVSDGLSFDNVVNEIFTAGPFNKNPDYPLILYLDFWHQDTKNVSTKNIYQGFQSASTYYEIYNILKKYFPKYFGLSGQTPHGHGGATQNTSLGNIAMNDAKGRLLIMSNINPQTDTNVGSLGPYLYGTVAFDVGPTKTFNNCTILNEKIEEPDPNIRADIYYGDLSNMSGIIGKIGGGITDFKKLNQTSIGLYIPDVGEKDSTLLWKNSLTNPNFLDCFQYGCQMVFMNYQECFKQTNAYIEFFKNKGFIVKRDELRYINPSKSTYLSQNSNASYATKNIATVKDFYIADI